MANNSGSELNFIIFLVIYIMVIGIVSSVFNPQQYSFGAEDTVSGEQFGAQPNAEKQDKGIITGFIDAVVGAVTGFIRVIATIVTFLWSAFTLNIPDVPWMVRIIMCSPIYGGMAYVIIKLLMEGKPWKVF